MEHVRRVLCTGRCRPPASSASSSASCSACRRCGSRRSISRSRPSRSRSRCRRSSSSSPLEHWTGGVQGIVLIKPDAPFGLPLNPDQWLYYFTLGDRRSCLLVGAVNLVHSRTGRAMMAIRDNPIAARAMGIDIALYKTLTFGVSALYTGVAGALGAIVDPVRRARQLHLLALRRRCSSGWWSAASAGSRARCSAALFVLFVPNIAEHVSKGLCGRGLWHHPAPGHLRDAVRRRQGSCGCSSAGSRQWSRSAATEGEEAMKQSHTAALVVAAAFARLALAAAPAPAPEEIRSRRERHRDQDRQHQPLQRPGLGLRHDRQDHRRLFQEGERRGRHQRPQDQLHLLRRRLQPAEDGRAGAQAGRERRGAAGVPAARHAVEHARSRNT